MEFQITFKVLATNRKRCFICGAKRAVRDLKPQVSVIGSQMKWRCSNGLVRCRDLAND